MKRMTLAVAVALGTLAPAAAGAVTEANFLVQTAGDLVELCSADKASPMGTAALNFCHGFVVGAVRVEQAHASASRRNQLFCLPSPTPARDPAIADFVAWAKADPARLSQRPQDALLHHISERYPCSRNK